MKELESVDASSVERCSLLLDDFLFFSNEISTKRSGEQVTLCTSCSVVHGPSLTPSDTHNRHSCCFLPFSGHHLLVKVAINWSNPVNWLSEPGRVYRDRPAAIRTVSLQWRSVMQGSAAAAAVRERVSRPTCRRTVLVVVVMCRRRRDSVSNTVSSPLRCAAGSVIYRYYFTTPRTQQH